MSPHDKQTDNKVLEKVQRDAALVKRMLELGDNRLLAADGPCGGLLPDLSPDEWGKVYRACKRIAEASI